MDVAERFEDLVTWQVLRQLEIEVQRLATRAAIKRDFKSGTRSLTPPVRRFAMSPRDLVATTPPKTHDSWI
jgi:hypothetical protein